MNDYRKSFDSMLEGINTLYYVFQFAILATVGLLGLVAFLSFRLYNQRPETQYGPQGEMWIPGNGCFIPFQADIASAANWCQNQSLGP